ncbi:gamma-glutamyltransferase [candidate division KSB1 bacterium]|nr:gamma-glutamyltransferase [candidate division KSB1 bacterium]
MPIDFKAIEARFIPTDDGRCTFSPNGIVASQSSHASEAGAEILRAGGNAVDAAIAAAFTAGVTEPQASGLGGQTMMLIFFENKVIAVDGSSRAPSLAHVSAVYKRDRSTGYRATTVPSTPATLWYIQDRYGQLPWAQVVEPAIALAQHGYHITPLQNQLLTRERDNFFNVDSHSGANYFLKEGEPYLSGDIFKQPDLANTLQRIAENGIEEFYRGTIARQIDADMRENGGLLRMDDLALIPFPIEREPLVRSFRGLDVYTMPPPGSGRSLLFALMMLDLLPQQVEMNDPLKEYLLFIHILRKTFLERSDRPFDPNFFRQTEDEQDMLDPLYARESLLDILKDVDKSVLPFVPTEDELTGETTHLSIIDRDGMAVSLTQSIERVYGSKAAADGLGFLYNNYLFDFEYTLPEHPFYLRPNAVPWATVAPTMVFNGDDLWMVLGSPGSERIISTLARFLLNMIDNKMSLAEAMMAPRLHCSLGGRVSLEAGRLPESLLPFLEYKGFRIDKREDYAFYLGCVQAVLKKHDGSGFQGVADVRRDGSAVGV